MAPPRIVFMGTPGFAVPALLACFEVGEVVAVVTQPDKPKGRGQEVQAPPVKVEAVQRGVPVLQPQKLKTPPFHEVLAPYQPDVAVVAAYGKILPPALLELPVHGSVNLHASLLPRWRGAAPIQWALASGDAKTGVCLMRMEAGLDTGPILAQRELDIGPEDTSASLHDRLSELAAEVVRAELLNYLAGKLVPQVQPEAGVTLAPPLQRDAGQLDFTRPAVELERRIRAFTPWPGASTRVEGALLKVHQARVGQGHGQPGEVLSAGPGGLEVACQVGSLVLLEVQAEGKRRMRAQEYLQGRRIEVGTRPFAA